MTVTLSEDWVDYGAGACWITFGQLTCDFCDVEVNGEIGNLQAAAMDGWTGDRALNRDMCLSCRRRALEPIA